MPDSTANVLFFFFKMIFMWVAPFTRIGQYNIALHFSYTLTSIPSILRGFLKKFIYAQFLSTFLVHLKVGKQFIDLKTYLRPIFSIGLVIVISQYVLFNQYYLDKDYINLIDLKYARFHEDVDIVSAE